MVPNLFVPSVWLTQLASLPRPIAAAALLLGLAMLWWGGKGFRYFVVMVAAGGGWVIGTLLAEIMYISQISLYVALPSALICALLTWPILVASRVLIAVLTFMSACGAGAFVAYGMRLGNYWVGFVVGVILAGLLLKFAKQFAQVLFFALFGALLVISSLGATLAISSEPLHSYLHPKALFQYPAVYVIVAVVLVASSIARQILNDPEHN